MFLTSVRRNDIDQAFQKMEDQHFQAVVVFTANLMFVERKRISALGLKHRLAVNAPAKLFVDAGTLLSYGTDFPTIWHRAAYFIDKILKGEGVGDIPIEQPTKFDFCLNLSTAKVLGIEIPPGNACACRRGDRMKRREFIALVGGAAAAWPTVARAQQSGRIRRIGVLFALAESDRQAQSRLAAFRGGLQKLGWADITIDARYVPSNDAETHQRYAKELVALQPDLLLAQNTDATGALLQQTRIIPIIFTIVADPIGSGFVASFARLGGNVTGFVTSEPTMGGKWLELLKEIAQKCHSGPCPIQRSNVRCRILPELLESHRCAPWS